MRLLLFFSLLIGTFSSNAQESNFIIKKVTVFDGEQVLEDMDVVVREGKIDAVLKSKKKNEKGLEVVEGKGKFLMPGLMNAHVHAWAPDQTKEAALAGVLTVFDMMGNPFSMQMNKNAAEKAQHASYFSAGFGATVPGGHGTQFGLEVPTIKSDEDIIPFVQARVDENVDYLKILYEPLMEALTPQQVNALIQEAHRQELLAVTHISFLENALEVAEFGGDGLVHSWFDKVASDEQIDQLAESGIWIVPTALVIKLYLPLTRKNFDVDVIDEEGLLENIRKMYQADILLLAGTDPPNAQINYGTDLYKELYLFRDAGLTPIDILKTATSNVAKAFQLDDRGLIQPGLRADLLLIDGNPLERIEDVEKIERIWKAGELVED
ncbi:MAG: amidohydrolase family protein [Saprospiraceae bacterium]|nr:amidohydrolase family protein [Saprospiraceae bacterium]